MMHHTIENDKVRESIVSVPQPGFRSTTPKTGFGVLVYLVRFFSSVC